jgi:hypothetical protein
MSQQSSRPQHDVPAQHTPDRRRAIGGLRASDTPTGPIPIVFPVTAKQAAAVRDSLTERHRVARAAAEAGQSEAALLAGQTEEALREVERYVDHGGGLSDGLVELLADLDIVLVPLRATRTA